MSNRKTFFSLFLLLVLSFLLTTIYFRPADIFSNSPIYTDDYAMHFSNCLAAKKFWKEDFQCWGYDPFLLAGFPRCVLANADNKAWEVFFILLSPVLGEGRAFKFFVVLFLTAYPLLIYRAARNFRLSQTKSVLAVILGMLFFYLSLPKELVRWGMVSYVVACYFSLYVFSRLYLLLEQFRLSRYIILTILASVLFMVHVLSPIHIFLPAFILYLCFFKKLTRVQHIMLFCMMVFILAVNSFWLKPIFDFLHYKTTRPENYEFTLQIKNISEFLKVYLLQKRSVVYTGPALNNTFFEGLLLVLGVAGLFQWYKNRQFALFFPFSVGVLFIAVITYLGSHTIFFAQFQPQRFSVPMNLLLLFPASAGLLPIVKVLFYKRSYVERMFVAFLLFVVFYQPIVRTFGMLYKTRPFLLSCTVPSELEEMLAFLDKNTTQEGRILIEDSEATHEEPEAYYGAHYPGLFPEYVKREYLCGPRPMYPVKHSYASFTEGLLFEKKLLDYSLFEMQEMFKTYNAKWIVCWLQESKDFLAEFPEYVEKLATIDKFTIYEVKRKASFFLKGTGRVKADYNRIELNGLIAEDGEVIIAYHWMETLRAAPDVKLERFMVGGDPVGLIKILNPPSSLVIRNVY